MTSVAEQAPMSQLVLFAASLWSHPAKALAGHRLPRCSWKCSLPYRLLAGQPHSQTTATGMLKSVRLTDGAKTWDERMRPARVRLSPCAQHRAGISARLRSSRRLRCSRRATADLRREHVYCAGEPTGIAGLDAALLQGEIAGLACAGTDDRPLCAPQQAAERNLPHAWRPPFGCDLNSVLLRCTRDHRLPLRRCDLRQSRGPQRMDRRKAADAMRNGTMPGAYLRSGDRDALWMDAEVDSSAFVSCSRERSLFSRLPTRCSLRRMHDLVWRNARNDDTL